MIIDLIICGTFALAGVMIGSAVTAAKNANQTKRAASLQKKAIKGDLSGRKLAKALLKNYKRQIVALRWGNRPLMERVNFFDYNVNDDPDFKRIWDKSSLDKSWRKLGICKSKKKIAELKRRGVGKAAKKVKKMEAKFGVGPMKTMGWTEAEYLSRSAGGQYVNRIIGYGTENEDGTYGSGVDNEIRFQMIATSDDSMGYDPGDIFQQLQKNYRKRKNDRGAEFSRFGISYPTTSRLNPDRFVVGVSPYVASSSEIFCVSKIVMIANACAKLVENPNVKKVQIIDESFFGGQVVRVVERQQFAEQAKKILKSKGMKWLNALDSEQAKAVKETIDNFTTTYEKENSGHKTK